MDITSLLGNVMDKDMLEKLSKSANVSTADVSNVLKNAAPSVMKHLDGDSDVAKAVKEVKAGFECGLTLKNYNDIKVGDQIEVYEIQEIARTL